MIPVNGSFCYARYLRFAYARNELDEFHVLFEGILFTNEQKRLLKTLFFLKKIFDFMKKINFMLCFFYCIQLLHSTYLLRKI